MGLSALSLDQIVILADSAAAQALASADVASVLASAVEQGATITLSPQVAGVEAAVTSQLQAPDLLQTAAWSLFRSGAVAAAAVATLRLLRQDPQTTGPEEDEEPHRLTEIPQLAAKALVRALRKPASLLLPASVISYTLRSLGEIAAAALALSNGAIALAADPTAAFLGRIDQLAGAGASSAINILFFWVAIAWKDEVVKKIQGSPDTPDDVAIITRPLSTIASAGLGLAGSLSVAESFNINLAPVMAVGGISTIVLGFGSQIVTANAISGANLYFGQTFVKGDRVVLMTTGGSAVITGYVEVISLLYTTIRTELGAPVSIPNKAVAEMLVKNETRIKFSNAMTTFKQPRQLLYTFRIRLQDRDKVNAIIGQLELLFKGDPDVDQSLPAAAWLGAFGDYYIEMGMLVHCTGKAAAGYGGFRQRWIQTAEAVMRQAGAAVPAPTSILYTATTAVDGPAMTAGDDSGSSSLLSPIQPPVADEQLQLSPDVADATDSPS